MDNQEENKRIWDNVLLLQNLNRGYSTCMRCGLPWNHCEKKSIGYTEGRGVFAICTYCWNISDLDERLHHFKTLWYEHKNRYGLTEHYEWSLVEKKIREES